MICYSHNIETTISWHGFQDNHYYSSQNTQLGKLTDNFSSLVGCIASSSAMKAIQYQRHFYISTSLIAT